MRHVRFVRHRDCAGPEHTVHSVLLGQLPLLGTSASFSHFSTPLSCTYCSRSWGFSLSAPAWLALLCCHPSSLGPLSTCSEFCRVLMGLSWSTQPVVMVGALPPRKACCTPCPGVSVCRLIAGPRGPLSHH